MDDEIRCPACSYEFDSEDACDYVTYHGEDGPQDVECPNCEAALTV